MKKVMLGSVMSFMAMVYSASALLITPSSTPVWTGADGIAPEGPLNPLNAAQVEVVLGLLPGALTEVYKDNVGGVEENSLAGSYDTSYVDESEATAGSITYTGGTSVDPTGLIYLGFKGGSGTSPYWFLFDLTGVWDGEETIEFSGLWEGIPGSISHVSLFTGEKTNTPDGGLTLALLGLGLAGMGATRRFIAG